MELSQNTAREILREHRIEISDEDHRSAIQIASQLLTSGDIAVEVITEQQSSHIELNTPDQNYQIIAYNKE